MGKLYGCWLQENFDSDYLTDKVKKSHSEYFPAYLRRIEAISSIAEIFVENVGVEYPALKGRVFYSYPSIISAVGRYINDVMHYKLWHHVKITNKAKILAHTIKWLSHYPVISINLDVDQYKLLTEQERIFILEINTLFIGVVIRYFLSFFCDGDIPASKSYGKMFYLIDTGQYDVKTAAVAFDGMLI